jgi:hypothetical protein
LTLNSASANVEELGLRARILKQLKVGFSKRVVFSKVREYNRALTG